MIDSRESGPRMLWPVIARRSPAKRRRHAASVSTRDRALNRGTRRGRRFLIEIGQELRERRLQLGLSQAAVADALGISRAQVSRIERAALPSLSLVTAARLASLLGLELAVRLFPGGPPLRDAGHAALLARFSGRISATFRWRIEVPLPIPGDQRAFDGLLTKPGLSIAVEAEMRPRDLQALQRRMELKKRDGAADRLILLVPDTRSNRDAIRAAGASLAGAFPAGTRQVMSALAAGRDPGSDGLVVL
jgi:transcriptional regulator with XRE-family HTH domain